MNGQDVHVHTHTHTGTHKYTSAENNMAQDRRGNSAGDSYGNFV